LPIILDEPMLLSQGVSFVFFLLIYLGIALGLRRYRLFDLDIWAFRIMFYLSALLGFVLLDVLIILMLDLSADLSSGISILVIGFGYLPLRDYLWRRLQGHHGAKEQDYFREVIDVVFPESSEQRSSRWHKL